MAKKEKSQGNTAQAAVARCIGRAIFDRRIGKSEHAPFDRRIVNENSNTSARP